MLRIRTQGEATSGHKKAASGWTRSCVPSTGEAVFVIGGAGLRYAAASLRGALDNSRVARTQEGAEALPNRQALI